VAFTPAGLVFAQDKAPAPSSKHRGPLNVSNTFPAALFFLNYRPLRTENLRRGESRLLFDVDEANTIVIDQSPDQTASTVLDTELTQYRLDIATGLTRKIEIGISASILYYHGLFMDGFIESVEGAFGKPSRVRKLRKKNDFKLFLAHDGKIMLDRQGDVAGLSDTTFRLKYALMEERAMDPLDLSARFEIKAPTGNKSRGMGSGSFDFGFALTGHKSYGNYHFQGDFAYLAPGKLRLGGDFDPSNVLSGLIATEYAWKKTSGILQFLFTQTALKNIGIPTLEESGEAVTLGLKHDVGREAIFQISMTENISDVTFSDFSVNAGIEYRFGKKNFLRKRGARKRRGALRRSR